MKYCGLNVFSFVNIELSRVTNVCVVLVIMLSVMTHVVSRQRKDRARFPGFLKETVLSLTAWNVQTVVIGLVSPL